MLMGSQSQQLRWSAQTSSEAAAPKVVLSPQLIRGPPDVGAGLAGFGSHTMPLGCTAAVALRCSGAWCYFYRRVWRW